MEQHRTLFKTNTSLARDKTNNIKAVNEKRAKQRRDLYSSKRNISPSPSPKRQAEQKENLNPTENAKLNAEKLSPGKENQKCSRQKAYLMKYLAWKANKIKDEQIKKEQTKRPAFVVPCGSGSVNVTKTNIKKSFAPKNHTFKPPDNLNELNIEPAGQNKFRCVTGTQQVVFNFIPTPKKENIQSKIASMKLKTSRPIDSKPLYLKPTPKPEVPILGGGGGSKLIQNNAKTPLAISKCVRGNTVTSKVTRQPLTQPVLKSSLKKTPIEVRANPIKNGSDGLTKTQMKPHFSLKPPLIRKDINIATKLKSLQPSHITKNVKKITTAKTISTSTKTANSHSGLPPLKRPAFKAQKKNSSSISNAFLTVNANMNQKKSTNTSVKYLLPNAKTDMAETPADPNSFDAVFEFVTSTKRKSLSLKDSKADLLSTAERDIISPIETAPARPEFVRYSILQIDAEKTPIKDELQPKKSCDDACTKENEKTPVKTESGNSTPSTYMSPYVSVSRGKVSTKVEREKRNSVYLGTDNLIPVPEAVAAEHHAMATVRYYQKQLTEEIDRLNKQCKVWEEYKEANPQLGDIVGTDMIDATVGQTRLLICKKLKQFGGLIDRCEEGLRRKNTTNNDENFLPVLPEDLDGFWSMVGLQIENVDKRFANIERWKANNWTDPDEGPVQPAKLKKIKKSKRTATTKPNQCLQNMLKAAHAAYLKKKALGATDDDVILTPSRRQVVIKDRRSRSAAATVITVNTTKVERMSSDKKQVDLNQTPKLIPHVNGFRKSMNLLKSTLLGEQDRISPVDDNLSSPRQTSSRKSILKTPGSTRKSKNVIFSSKALKFTFEDTLNDFKPDLDQETEEMQRTYKLRNRRIVLRDSAEFVIPK